MLKRLAAALFATAAIYLATVPCFGQAYPTPNQGAPSGTASGVPAMGAAGGTAQNCLPGTMCLQTVLPLSNGSELQVAQHPTGIFVDDFACVGVPSCVSGTLDTTNKWNAPTTGGGGNATAATNAVGATVMGSGNVASGWSILQTQAVFQPQNPGYLFSQMQVKVEATTAGLFKTNAFRAFGDYSAPGSPTTSLPLTDAVVFVIDTAGKLRAQTWASGALNFDSDLSVFNTLCQCTPQTLVGDGATHRYVRIVRGDNILFKIDDRFVAQVTTGALGPDVNSLRDGGLAVAGGTPPATSATIEFDQVTMGTIAGRINQLCDSFFTWRCVTVGTSGALSVSSPATTNVATAALAANLVINAGAGGLYGMDVSADATLSAAAWWIMIYNATAAPVDGAVTPARCIAMPSGATSYTGAFPGGLPFATGIVIGVSTTGCFTKTASTHAFIAGDFK